MTGRSRSLARVLAAATILVAGLSSTAAYASEAAPLSLQPQIGIQFNPDGSGQCEGSPEQWAESPNWTQPIRLDTDNRPGGCELAFGINDPDGTLAGSTISYKIAPSAGAGGTQCGTNLDSNKMPILPIPAFGPPIRVDTDSNPGWCNLTFTVTGRIVLDVQLYADGDPGQCQDTLPVTHSAFDGSPATVKIDTDNRAGGCQFLLRLRHF